MWKLVLAGSAAVAIICHSAAFAQQPGRDATADGARHWRPSAEDIAAFADARVAAIKAGLKLGSAQEKNWPAFEEAYRGLAKLRAERMKARFEDHAKEANSQQQSDNVNPIERLQKRADTMMARATALKHLADAASPLYQSLDDGQKHRFTVLAHLHERHRAHGEFGRERRREEEAR
jgi:hypothetical protein